VACDGDDGYLEHGYTFAFRLDAYPDLLAGASWANWTATATYGSRGPAWSSSTR
jgi:hypothetical protein